jgi:Mg/Co/Ni transporter MgtE
LPVYFRTVSDHTAASVMDQNFQRANSGMTVFDGLKEFDVGGNKVIFVFDEKEEKLVGLISKNEVKKMSKDSQKSLTLGDVAFKKFNYIFSNDYLFTVIEKMNAHSFDVIPVISQTPGQSVIGVVTAQNIMDLLALEEKKKN